MQDNATRTSQPGRSAQGTLDPQAQLYREIGISAVAAALRSIGQPDPGKKPTDHSAAPRPENARPILAA